MPAELLAPAGDFECLQFALDYGADAVYLAGAEFGMRSACPNFAPQELAAAVKLAHGRGKRIYLTLNTIPRNAEMDRLPAAVEQAAEAGVDAFIVADLGVLRLVKQLTPGVEVHLSTQAGVCNWAAAEMALELGAGRVILARELSLEEIAEIRRRTPKELALEVFVHGSMCMSVSGRCLLSNYLTGRDGNRGSCAQPCRWSYSLVEEKCPGQYFPVEEGEGGAHILSADDLCAAPFLDKVLAAGATSLKIEGRAKSFYYAASATATYRMALNAALAAEENNAPYSLPAFSAEELERTSHRPFSSGFYLGPKGATQSPKESGYTRRWQVVGVVQAQRAGRLHCVQRGKYTLGEPMEALLPEGRHLTFTPQTLWNEAGEAIPSAPHAKMAYSVDAPAGESLPPRTILRTEKPEGQ